MKLPITSSSHHMAGRWSFLSLPARLVPHFWLSTNNSAQCKTIPIPLHLLTCLQTFCFHASAHSISFWLPKIHPLSTSGPGGAYRAASRHSALFLGFACLSGKLFFQSCCLSTVCALAVLRFLMDFSAGIFYPVKKGEAGALPARSVTTHCSEAGSWNIAAPKNAK